MTASVFQVDILESSDGTQGTALLGFSNGVSQAAGYVGEVIEASQTVSTAVSTSAYSPGFQSSAQNVLSLSLTPGVWAITASLVVQRVSGILQAIAMSVTTDNTTSWVGTVPTNAMILDPQTGSVNVDWLGLSIPRVLINISSPATYYLKLSLAGNAANTYQAYLSALRIR